MINRVTGAIPKATTLLANNAGKKGDRLKNFMKNPEKAVHFDLVVL